MSSFDAVPAALCSFLLTYLIHSSAIISGVVLLVRYSRRIHHPALRVLAWKLALVLPLLTTSWITCFPASHWGAEILLRRPTSTSLESGDEAPPEESLGLPATEPNVAPIVTSEEVHLFVASASVQQEPVQSSPFDAAVNRETLLLSLAFLWGSAVCVGLIRLFFQTVRLRALRSRSAPCSDAAAHDLLNRLVRKMRLDRDVELLESREVTGAFTAGILRPFIVVPIQGEEDANGRMAHPEWEALLAHELAHVAHRDAIWNLFTQTIVRLLPFQPFNRIVGCQLQVAMDFAADDEAANTLGGQAGLVQCLIRLGDSMRDQPTLRFTRWGLVAGMVAFRSTLGQRVERLLEKDVSSQRITLASKLKVLAFLLVFAMTAAISVPQAVAEKRIDNLQNHLSSIQESSMKSRLSAFTVLLGLASPMYAAEPQDSQPVEQAKAKVLKATPDELPRGIQQFNGMLVGRLAAKDVEKGSFVAVVDAVPRVWRNSKAENPKSIVGKSIKIEEVFGRFLDVLVTTRIGETLEFECKHDGDALVFPGELLRKVAPYKAEDYPELPEEFRGFRGAVVADIKKKDPETFELIVEVEKVVDVWKENAAKQPESIVGKQMMLAGFWNRKETYHDLKVGDRIQVGMQHIGRQSDHLTVAEFVRKGDQVSMRQMRREEPTGEAMMQGVRGFRGMLVGRLVKKDVERGTFAVTVDAVPRVWKNNQSSTPKSLIGQNVDAEGVPSQLLDALVVTRIGETIQFGALHDGEESLRVGEVLRKVAPVEKGDYPELPDQFRGFDGVIQARVVKKDEQLWELTAEVTDIVKSSEKDRSENAKSVVGKQVMLSGFWNKKDVYHNIAVGDKIQMAVEHPQKLGDQLSVIEGVRKLDE